MFASSFFSKILIPNGKNPTKAKYCTTETATNLSLALAKLFDLKSTTDLAKATKFIQRKSKLCAVKFLTTLMFVHQQGKLLSLLNICGDLHTQYGLQARKQSIHERFNKHAAAFMKSILTLLGRYTKIAKK